MLLVVVIVVVVVLVIDDELEFDNDDANGERNVVMKLTGFGGEGRVDPCLVFNNFSFLSILFLYRSIPISLLLKSANAITSFIVFLGQRYFIEAALSHN